MKTSCQILTSFLLIRSHAFEAQTPTPCFENCKESGDLFTKIIRLIVDVRFFGKILVIYKCRARVVTSKKQSNVHVYYWVNVSLKLICLQLKYGSSAFILSQGKLRDEFHNRNALWFTIKGQCRALFVSRIVKYINGGWNLFFFILFETQL